MTGVLTQNFELSEAELRQISNVVYSYCGINLHDGKKDLVRARIAKQLRLGGFATAGEYLAAVRADESGRCLLRLIDAVSTNLTSFFREPSHFRYLSEVVLPDLLERKSREGQMRIRIWSAGCSSGEEPYTLAMLLDTALRNRPGWDVKILATDISTHVLEMASAAEYAQARLGEVPADLLQEYFVALPRNLRSDPLVYSVGTTLRRLVTFRRLNLMDTPWPFNGSFDFIFCRNVMIYFDHATQQRLLDRYWERLEGGGLLFTGHAESLAGVSHRFRYVGPTIYEKI